MATVKKERNLKVYGYESKWYDLPAEIRLKGKWLKELGFTVNSSIRVICEKERIVIEKIR